ncbi:hypothetical protein BC830DRAFT_1115806 [Chytriomyces sp. MP71]|nr:hypothetical protein BC830DRAFT_1115806 [Chytriomyces sp. MP71]
MTNELWVAGFCLILSRTAVPKDLVCSAMRFRSSAWQRCAGWTASDGRRALINRVEPTERGMRRQFHPDNFPVVVP